MKLVQKFAIPVVVLTWMFLSGAAFAAKETFDRSKPHVNIALVGHYHADAPGLLRQMSLALGQPIRRRDVLYSGFGDATSPSTASFVEGRYVLRSRQNRHRYNYFHMSAFDTSRNLSTFAHPVDGLILMVSATDGVMPQTREHILLARQVGLPAVVVFINLAGLDKGAGRVRRVERQARRLLDEAGFDGSTAPFVRGDAVRCQSEIGASFDSDCVAQVEALLAAVAEVTPLPPRDVDKPLLVAVEATVDGDPDRPLVTGTVYTGVVNVGDPVEIVGFSSVAVPAVVESIYFSGAEVEKAGPGNHVGLVLRGIEKADIRRGMVIVQPGSVAPVTRFRASAYILEENEGGRQQPFVNRFRPQIYLRTTDVTGEITLDEGREMVMPGDNVSFTVDLVTPMGVTPGLTFEVRDKEGTLAGARVLAPQPE